MKHKLIFLFLMFILLVPISYSWMPPTHWFILKSTILESPTSSVGTIAAKYPQLVMGGDLLTDLSVFYYFSGGFNNLGEAYRATHNGEFCRRMVALQKNEQELACAYGACSHQFEDSRSHNDFVPTVIRRTYLVNGLIHIFAEERVNDEILKDSPELNSEVKSALVQAAPVCKDLFRRALINDAAFEGIPFDGMYDDFVRFVGDNEKYSVGFQGFSSIPQDIQVLLLSFGSLNIISFVFFIRRKKKNIFNKISIGLNIFFVLLISTAYILFMQGNIWEAFQFVSGPVSNVMPVQGWQQSIEAAKADMIIFFNQGANYVLSIRDPSGDQALREASEAGATVRTIVNILVLLLIMLFIWLNFRKGKKKYV